MNYDHAYHAGNFADVLKHFVLVQIIKSLLKKETGFFYLDTHAGAGFYDLMSLTQKNKEFSNGIGKILQLNPPAIVKQYTACVQRINSKLSNSLLASFRYYPGSPMIVRHFLRPQDRMILTELHPNVFQQLKAQFGQDNRTHLHLMDGFSAIKNFLPPKERRGLILIDPPYERAGELNLALQALALGLKRFGHGIFALWFPIKDKPTLDRFYRDITGILTHKALLVELSVYDAISPLHLNGSGMLIVNPPFQLDQYLIDSLPWLHKTLRMQGQGEWRIRALNH